MSRRKGKPADVLSEAYDRGYMRGVSMALSIFAKTKHTEAERLALVKLVAKSVTGKRLPR